MQITREDLNPCTVELTVACTPEEVNQGFSKALKHYAKSVRVPGFRTGQAPQSMIEKMINPKDLQEKIIDEIIRAGYRKIIESENITPFDYPKYELKSFNQELGECQYKMKVPLAPIIELSDYKGIKIDKQNTDVTNEQLNEYLEALQKLKATNQPITDRAAQEEDTALIQLKALNNDQKSISFMVVIGKTFEELDQVIKDMKIEEVKTLDLNFPDNFQEKGWAGQKISCEVKLVNLSTKILPEIDDEFAKNLGDKHFLEYGLKSEDVAQLKEKIINRLMERLEAVAQEALGEQLLEQVVSSSNVQVPDTTWEEVAQRRLWDIHYEAQQQNKTIEDLLKEDNMSLEQLEAELKKEAKEQVIRATIAKEIFQREKLEITNELVSQAIEAMAHEHQVDPQTLVEQLKKQNRFSEIRFRAIFQRAIDFLKEHAEINNKATGKVTTSKK